MRKRISLFLLVGLLIITGCELLDEIDPEGDIRDKITGEWKVDEDSDIFRKKSPARFYNVSISKDPGDSTAVLINGFYELSAPVMVKIDGYNVTIPDQEVNSYTIENGYGQISLNYSKITLYYYVDLGIGEKDIVEAVYTRP